MSKFQQRHYEEVADLFRVQKNNAHTTKEKHMVDIVMHEFIDMFRRDNTRFSIDKFLRAVNE